MESLQSYLQNTISDFYTYPFLREMLLAALLGGISCSLVSVLVVLRKMALPGFAAGFAAWTGILVSFAFVPQWADNGPIVLLFSAGFGILAALVLAGVSRSERLSADTFVAVIFLGCLVLQALAESFRSVSRPDIHFWTLSMGFSESAFGFYLLSGLAVFVLLAILPNLRRLHVFCFDPSYASSLGIQTSFLHYFLYVLMAVTVVVSVHVLGVLLSLTMLVLPGACARLMTVKFKRMFVVSLLIGLLTPPVGFLISNSYSALPPALSIGLLQLSLFLLLFFLRLVWKK